MISRRTITIVACCVLAIAVPVSYTRGRSHEGRRLQPQWYADEDGVSNSIPVVFIETLTDGEPNVLRIISFVGVLLIGSSAISLAFDFGPPGSNLGKVPTTPEQTPEASDAG